MKKSLLIIVLSLLVSNSFGQNTDKMVSIEELKVIIGEWEGSLSYLDYSSGQLYTMPAKLKVEQGKIEEVFLLHISYPKEPKANSKDKISLSKNGKLINKVEIITKEIVEDGGLKITTEYEGEDDKKKALIRNVYLINPQKLIIQKQVKFSDSEEWILRNEYSFKK